jgi:hypothetical protein
MMGNAYEIKYKGNDFISVVIFIFLVKYLICMYYHFI